jgi:hypothetical protein
MPNAECSRERAHAFFGFGDIELDVHVAHLISFPGLHTGSRDLDHLSH